LTDFFREQQKHRGRRAALSDAELHNRRDQFVQIFEGEWGEIGWALHRCKKAQDVIQILGPLAASPSWIANVIEVFCRPSQETGSAGILRNVRSARRRVVEPLRLADESKRFAEDQLRQINRALTQAHGRSVRIVKKARKQLRKKLWKTMQEHRTLTDLEKRLQARLKSLEADFARQELMRFIKSKRYELMPLNLANAVAGLPYVGWRQSMRKNSTNPCGIANGHRYQIFKAIRYLLAVGKRKTEKTLVKGFQECIPLLPGRYRLPKAELAENWLYLERALRQAYRTKLHSKALPFEIAKRYFKQIHSPTQVDVVLAQQARITLSQTKIRVFSASKIGRTGP
jgi:hypothetical protein